MVQKYIEMQVPSDEQVKIQMKSQKTIKRLAEIFHFADEIIAIIKDIEIIKIVEEQFLFSNERDGWHNYLHDEQEIFRRDDEFQWSYCTSKNIQNMFDEYEKKICEQLIAM